MAVVSLTDPVPRSLSTIVAAFLTLSLLGMIGPASTRGMSGPGGGENDPFATATARASANFFTGAATVEVPILIPPGRTETTPDLALTYSSQAGLGPVGLGWSLSTGVISRSLRDGVPRCRGEFVDEFQMTLGGSANELVRVSDDLFHMKVDERYVEILPDRVDNTWSVRTEDGRIHRFGGTPEARVHTGVDTFLDATSCELTTSWHLTSVEDANGNHLEIAYEKRANTPIPARVEYGGNQEVSIAHPFRVRIESEDIPASKPKMRSFRSGVDQQLERRIKTIVVESWDTGSAAHVETRRYVLDYDDSERGQEFFLTSIAATGLPDRSFAYSTSTPTIVDDSSGTVSTDPIYLGRQFPTGPILSHMDMNGDGLMDRVRVVDFSYRVSYGESASDSQFTPQEYVWEMPSGAGIPIPDRIGAEDFGQDIYMVLDLDGDGKPDFVFRDPASQTIRVHAGECHRDAYDCGFSSQPSSWNNPGNLSLRHAEAWDSTVGGGRRSFRDVIDMNADGLPDLVRSQPNGLDVHLNTGSGFEVEPVFFETGENFLSYTSTPTTYTMGRETQMIDLNGDGLPDRVEGAGFHDWTVTVPAHPFGTKTLRYRAPLVYYAVDLEDAIHGPYALEGGPYLCPTITDAEAITLCHGASGYVLPEGWAIVPAMSVRLNTGAGFTDPIHSPSPFFFNAGGSAPRLRASTTDFTAQTSFPFRDFIDMNGDGRVDWVASGAPDGSYDTTWLVLYNQGDGRFGFGSLERRSGAYLSALGDPVSNLGDVRPVDTIAAGWHSLGETFHHVTSVPDGLSEQYAHVFDLDSDGIPELVTSRAMAGNRWNVKKILYEDAESPHTKPHLLTKIEDGMGGSTYLRYRPSSDFVSSASDLPGLPFTTWVVTGIRRTDGLCDATPAYWFSLEGNPCLAEGHEVVEQIEYADGFFDGATREFRGFGKVMIIDGAEEVAGERHLQFHQDTFLKGRTKSEELYVGGLDLLSRTSYDWRTVASGERTQVYLQEQKFEEFVLYSDAAAGVYEDQCVVHRSSIRAPEVGIDAYGRIHSACSMSCAGAGVSDDLCEPRPAGKKQIETRYADAVSWASHPVWNRPASIVTSFVNDEGVTKLSGVTTYAYDGLDSGTDRGNIHLERNQVSESPARWVERWIGHDNDMGPGVGNVISLRIPVSGQSRDPLITTYDPDFQLYPFVEAAPSTTNRAGETVQHTTTRTYDPRYGKVLERVGVHGRAAGDVSGSIYDELGRPVCSFEPGTSCEGGSRFSASLEYEYHTGDPDSADLVDRLSWVETRRLEPNAARGYLVTRSYRDALGRERITTNEQFIVEPPSPDGLPVLETVVVRHIDYGANGKPVRHHATYVPGASGISLVPPHGTSAVELSYVLNGNAAGPGQQGLEDPTGRVWQTTLHDGSTRQDFFYGRTTRHVDAMGGNVLRHVDEHGRLVHQQVFEGEGSLLTQLRASYGGRDDVVREWFGEDPSTAITSSHDLLGRLVARNDPDSGTWTARFDEAGNRIHQDDPQTGQSVQSCFDELDRVVLQCARNSDDPDPGLCESTSPVCEERYVYSYDEDDAVASATSFGKGHLTGVEGPASSHRYAYDVRGRLTHRLDEIQSVAGMTRYEYPAGIDRVRLMTYPDGEKVRYFYDQSGQPRGLWETTGVEGALLAPYVLSVKYDLRGRPIHMLRGNDTADELTYHGPEESFRLDRVLTHATSGSDTASDARYIDIRYDDYDGNGRLVRIVDDLVSTGPLSISADYVYDGAGRLQAVDGPNPEHFLYDEIGNITSINGKRFSNAAGDAPLGPHQFSRFGDETGPSWRMSFDANGQRTAKTRSDGAASQTHEFDAFGRMRTLRVNGVARSMGYDHGGMRVFERRNGETRRFFGAHAESEKGLVYKFYSFGERLIATRTDAAPALSGLGEASSRPHIPPEVYWVWMLVATTLLVVPLGGTRVTLGVRLSRGGALGSAGLVFAILLPLGFASGCGGIEGIRHYHLSHRSSPVALTGAGGRLDRQYRYSAYGEVRRYDAAGQPTAIDPESRREFTGYQTDPESELQYANARFYDPSQAQFLSLDPAEENPSPYAYVGWDPVNFTDPSGEWSDFIGYVFLALAAWLVIAQAIVTTVETGSFSAGISSLVLGEALLVVGSMFGFAVGSVAAATSDTALLIAKGSLAATGIGSSTYGVATSSETADFILAGAGLALAIAGTAFSFGARGGTESQAESTHAGFDESLSADPGVQVASADDIARIPGRALIKLNNDAFEAQLDARIAELRGQEAFSDRYAGLDVAAFKVRTTQYNFELQANRIVAAHVVVLARPPGTPGFPDAFKPGPFLSLPHMSTSSSGPIWIKNAAPIRLIPDHGFEGLQRGR